MQMWRFLTNITQMLGRTSKPMTTHQKRILMKEFQAKPRLQKEELNQLSQSLNISEPRIKNWFQNMRAAERRKGSLHMGE